MKKFIVYICVFFAIVGTIMPFVLYKIKHYWTASDMLSFYGACLSFLGTMILGFIATKQSKTANELAKKMLQLETDNNIPIIDIINFSKNLNELHKNELSGAYTIAINDSYAYYDLNNNVTENSGSIELFEIKNISGSNLMKVDLCNIKQLTIYQNQKTYETNICNTIVSTPIILPKNESVIFEVLGTEYEGPVDIDENEYLEQGYVMPEKVLELSFILMDDKGKEYFETIRINYIMKTNLHKIDCPMIIDKKVLKIEDISS